MSGELQLTYILDGHMPVPCDDMHEVSICLRDIEKRRVANSDGIGADGVHVRVSTVFLAINHGMENEPLLFETMAFGGPFDQECERSRSWDEAEACHFRWCEKVGLVV
jgi:hypothetical protein